MDDSTRDRLLATLAGARRDREDVKKRLETLSANIGQIRATLGNPYFYGGRPADDPESEAHFTGSRSHEPALALWQEWQDVARRIERINAQLKAAGDDQDR